MRSIFSLGSRTASAGKQDNESWYAFLDRCDWEKIDRARKVIDQLINRYPTEHLPKLLSRFRSRTEHQFESAFFELVLLNILSNAGLRRVQVEPNLDSGKTPDFQVTDRSGNSYLIEATIEFGRTEEELAGERRLNDFFRSMQKLESGRYALQIRVSQFPRFSLNTNKTRREVQEWINKLPDGLVWNSRYDERFSVAGFDFNVEVVGPKEWSPDDTFLTPPPASWLSIKQSVRKSINAKASRYRDAGIPLIVAINSVRDPIREFDLLQALFGDQVIYAQFDSNGDEKLSEGREPNGAFFAGEEKHTNVSAVLAFSELNFLTIESCRGCLVHNPFAEHTINHELFRGFDQLWPREGSKTIDRALGRDLVQLLNL